MMLGLSSEALKRERERERERPEKVEWGHFQMGWW